MPTKQFMKPCKTCERSTLHVQQVDSATPHVLLTIITAGLWLIPWVLRELCTPVRSPAQCTACGSGGLFSGQKAAGSQRSHAVPLVMFLGLLILVVALAG